MKRIKLKVIFLFVSILIKLLSCIQRAGKDSSSNIFSLAKKRVFRKYVKLNYLPNRA